MPLKLNQDEHPTINLTSMIDVLFLLIIFFMVGTRFTENESNLKINLAKVAPNGSMLPAPASKIVYVGADGSIQFQDQRVSPDQLASMLAQAVQVYPDTSVQVKSDGDGKVQVLTSVLRAIEKSGARNAGLAISNYQMPTSRR